MQLGMSMTTYESPESILQPFWDSSIATKPTSSAALPTCHVGKACTRTCKYHHAVRVLYTYIVLHSGHIPYLSSSGCFEWPMPYERPTKCTWCVLLDLLLYHYPHACTGKKQRSNQCVTSVHDIPTHPPTHPLVLLFNEPYALLLM